MPKPVWRLAVILLAGAIGGPALGSGFSIYEQGAKASAQADAFTARADDPSAIFYNPAGITQLEGTQLMAGGSAMIATTEFRFRQTGGSFFMERNFIFTPNIYTTHKLNDAVSFGIGVFSPFGLKTVWSRDFPGRFVARDSELKTIFINPTIAFRLDPRWSIAIGADYVYSRLILTRNLDFGNLGSDGRARFVDDTTGWGANMGLQYASERGLHLGVSWRGQVALGFDAGKATFRNISPAANASCGLSPCFRNQKASSGMRLPQVFAFGIGTHQKTWELEIDAVYHDWKVFKSLDIRYSEKPAGLEQELALQDVSFLQDWRSTFSYRLGWSRRLNDLYELRAGIFYDENPIPARTLSPVVPDSEHQSVQFGYGYASESKKFRYDAYYQYSRLPGNKATGQVQGLNGTYKTNIHQLGLAGTWTF